MSDRKAHCEEFLRIEGWGKAICTPLADDASFRCYVRLILDKADIQQRAVLMDAPPAFEDVRPFVAIARYLHHHGLAAPEIFATQIEQGFLLLEDLGDQLFVHIVDRQLEQEKPLYQLAVEGLLELQKSSPPSRLPLTDTENYKLPRYEEALLIPEVSLFVDWYLPALTGHAISDAERQEFLTLWRQALKPVSSNLDCLVLRDYHAENLMLRAGKEGLQSLGLLDFQDAVIGHKAYDLASLLQDARRDVSPELEEDMLRYYLGKTGADEVSFRRDYALLAAQRNTKIIGIFARLFLRDGKAGYLKLIPRVWGLLSRDFDHPALAGIKAWMDRHIAPDLRLQEYSPQFPRPQKAMILAAGLGLRMRPLTDKCPKPLIPVAGKALLSYALEGLVAAGINNVVINMHYLADQVEKFVGSYYDHRLSFSLSDERQALLDSGGGVKKALPLLGDEAFFILNSDMIWRDGSRPMIQQMQAFWQDDKMDVLLLLIPRAAAFGYDGPGDYNLGPNADLTHRGEADQADYVFGGVSIMKPGCFDDVTEETFSLRQIFDKAAAQGRLFGVIHDGEWYHVGTEEAVIRLEELFGEGD